jgi:hypothetical protein
MINVVCFWSEPEFNRPDVYTDKYIGKLFDGVFNNIKDYNGITAYCYTDRQHSIPIDSGINFKPLNSNLRGWWPKLSLFARVELMSSPTLYLDLDTVITGNIDKICEYVEKCNKFTILRDFYRPEGYGSGMMAWNGDYSYIWSEFCKNPIGIINKYNGVMGDQWFMQDMVKDANLWQDQFKDEIVSYKVDCVNGRPEKAKVVCFHGEPRPHDVGWKV